MCLLFVVAALNKLVAAVVHWSDSSEPILQSFVHFLMPLAVANHFFLLGEIFALAHGDDAMPVLSVVHIFAGS